MFELFYIFLILFTNWPGSLQNLKSKLQERDKLYVSKDMAGIHQVHL